MIFIEPILLLLLIVGGVLILKKLKKQRQKVMLAKAESPALARLTPIRREFWEKQPHISFKKLMAWADGQLDENFLDRQLTGEWRLHVDACTGCQQIIEFYREERKNKLEKLALQKLQN